MASNSVCLRHSPASGIRRECTRDFWRSGGNKDTLDPMKNPDLRVDTMAKVDVRRMALTQTIYWICLYI